MKHIGHIILALDDSRLAEAKEKLVKAKDAYMDAVSEALESIRDLAVKDQDTDFLEELEDEREGVVELNLAANALRDL